MTTTIDELAWRIFRAVDPEALTIDTWEALLTICGDDHPLIRHYRDTAARLVNEPDPPVMHDEIIARIGHDSHY